MTTPQLADSFLRAAQVALNGWNLSATDIELVSHSENIVYRVHCVDGACYALRLHRPGYHNLLELNSEQQWTAALAQAGIDVPHAIPLPAGGYYTRVDVPDTNEQRYVGLVGWLEGELLSRRFNQETAEKKMLGYIRDLGGIAARIHNQAVAWEIPDGFCRHQLNADGFLGDNPFWGPFWNLPHFNKTETKLIRKSRAAIYDALVEYGQSSFNYSMIHADLHHGNLLVDGDALHIIDFDDAGFGWHLYELAVALFSFQDSKDYGNIRDALLEGYRSHREIRDRDVALLPMFLLIRGLALLGWMHHRPELGRHKHLEHMTQLVCRQTDAMPWILQGS